MMKNGDTQTQRYLLAQAWRYFRAHDRRAARAMWKALNDPKSALKEIDVIDEDYFASNGDS